MPDSYVARKHGIRQRGRPATAKEVELIYSALTYLGVVKSLLRQAGALHALAYVQRAAKSTQGAYNHAAATRRRLQEN